MFHKRRTRTYIVDETILFDACQSGLENGSLDCCMLQCCMRYIYSGVSMYQYHKKIKLNVQPNNLVFAKYLSFGS
jgi:hypothetical protein